MDQKQHLALLGDIGGTNIRLQLVTVDMNSKQPVSVLKKANLSVVEFDTLELSIRQFLKNTQAHPETAVLGIAGPVFDNSVELANVKKWGLLKGQSLGQALSIKNFRFINDFEAASYGILLVSANDFECINGLPIDQTKTRGIIGPGTGLGNSVLYNAKIKQIRQVFVLPCEAGHTDFPQVDQEVLEYYKFYSSINNNNYVSLENGFCGPSFPIIFRYFAHKYHEDPQAKLQNLTSQQIITRSLQPDSPRIFQKTLETILKIYGAAIGNFIAHHLCVGGLYLIGSITNSLIPRLKQIDVLQGFKVRHPILINLISKVPIFVCKQLDLGLKGSFYVAQKIIKDQS